MQPRCRVRGALQRLMSWWGGWGAHDWFTALVIMLLTIVTILLQRKELFVARLLIIIAGLAGSYLLFRSTKEFLHRIWRSATGKVALGFFSLLVVTWARILADQQIAVTIGVSASLFPRAQDIFTLFFALSCGFSLV
jgi:hypothetical protein